MSEKPEWEQAIEDALERGEPIQVLVEDDDSDTTFWAFIDPATRTCTERLSPVPGVRTYPPDAAN